MAIEEFFHLLPLKYRKLIEKEAKFAGIKNYKKITIYSIISIPSISIPLILFSGQDIYISAALFLGAIGISYFFPYLFLSLSAERRKRAVEEVLPDALLLMSSNIKSGLTIDKAFLLSAREEFGPLAEEIKLAAMQMFSGKSVEDVLGTMKRNTNSEILQEVISLISDGMRAGGEISKLLESSAKDIRKTMLLRKEAEANIKTYTLFISMAALFAAPFLFAISNYLAETTANIWSSTEIDFSKIPSQGSIFKFTKPEVNMQIIGTFSILTLSIISFFSSLIISEIKYGTVKQGFKNGPIFLAISLAIYYLAKFAIKELLGGLISI